MLATPHPLGRLPYFVAGVALFAVKLAIDVAVSRAFGRPWSVLYYVSPTDAPLLRPGDDVAYWLTLWAVALPFLAVGLVLTVRRLADADLPGWLAALFFVPFANLVFFAVCAVMPPPRAAPRGSRPPGPGEERGFGVSVLLGGVAGAVVALATCALAIGAFERYGAALFLGAPVIGGWVSASAFGRLHRFSVRGAVLASLASVSFGWVVALSFAFEGVVCLAIATPLVVLGALVGVLVSWLVACARGRRTVPGAPALLLPLLFVAEAVDPLPRPPAAPVETAVEIDAPPAVVWERVAAFPPLPPPTELVFRLGVAAPTGARIEGAGVGAVRRCEFTTGEFVEPIEVWEPGRELSFAVVASPAPLRELTLWGDARPPHLDGYLESTRGQFVLEPLPGGRTRLVGRTWYRTNMAPEAYWRLWADAIVRAIHRRVLQHVAKLAEADARAAGG